MMVSAPRSAVLPHAILIVGLLVVLFPVYVALDAASRELADILQSPMSLIPGTRLFTNLGDALAAGSAKTSGQSVLAMMANSLVMAVAIAVGKIAISYAVFCLKKKKRILLRKLWFWAIFVTLMLPVQVRIIST